MKSEMLKVPASAAVKYKKTVYYYTIRSKEPDSLGRESFDLEWFDEKFHLGPQWRVQCFFSILSEHRSRAEELGHEYRKGPALRQ